MKRLHVHVYVSDLERSIQFYKTLFGVEPTVSKNDYAKWILDDPVVNFAISTQSGAQPGIDHIGIQTSNREDLHVVSERLKGAAVETFDEQATTCCYAISDKSWVEDPSGVRWETFYSYGETTTYGADASRQAFARRPQGCCAESDHWRDGA